MNYNPQHELLGGGPRVFLGIVVSVCAILFCLSALAFAAGTGVDLIGW